ncbi:ATP-dependent DNA ligase [Streptomyces zhihengii]|uniref:ATP-dependent DNA ligase n=1 Tax=Streptomyces zhihengii TaxID=1818004 RepID=UPI003632DD44
MDRHRRRTPTPPAALTCASSPGIVEPTLIPVLNLATTRGFNSRPLQESANPRASAWDVLVHPQHGNVRGRPYSERRALLLDLVGDLGPPMPATDGYETAMIWCETLQEQGAEGIVAKRAGGTYRGGSREWRKIRHAETEDLVVAGYTGARSRPRALAVRRPDGAVALSQRLTGPLAAAAAHYLQPADAGPRRRTHDGQTYTTTPASFLVEALTGTTRHAVVTITRVR